MKNLVSGLLWLLVRILLGVVFYATPVIGFWLASSLEAYLGGPPWMAWTAGALLFPIIPLFWELHGWAYRKPDSKAWFTPLDRIGLKTFAVGLAFIIGLLYFYPQMAFVALSTRGDWMLDDVKDARADKARKILFATAGGLQWLYAATKTNPYKAQIDTEAVASTEQATEQLEQEEAKQQALEIAQKNEQDTQQQQQQQQQQQTQQSKETETKKPTKKADSQTTENGRAEKGSTEEDRSEEDDTGEDAAQKDQQSKQEIAKEDDQKKAPAIKGLNLWPWTNATLHPVVANMPASAETSIKAVAQYIAKREKDPVQRIKALHDYVADRIAYDHVAYYSNTYPSQSAKTVFKTRKGVCAGYANLLAALASAMGEKIVVVVGDSRDSAVGDKLASGGGHAWNAASINGKWYLLDVTWDAGNTSREKGFEKAYRTDYLLTPPEVMIQSHFPEAVTWQLLDQPLSLGEFLRQPMLDPSFLAAHLTLIRPTRAVNETDSNAAVIVKNPDKQWLMVDLEQNGKTIGNGSEPNNEKYAKLERTLPGKGRYRMNIFASKEHYANSYDFVGSVDFVNR